MLSRILAASLAITALAPAAQAQSSAADARFQAAQDRFDREYQIYRQEADRYQAARGGRAAYAPPPAYDNGYRRAPDAYGYSEEDEAVYDPARDYRGGTQYRERIVQPNERVYAGYDGRYYCRRNDGTTGLIVGGAAGGILGNVIDGGRSRILGTLLGGAAGALAGRAVDQDSNVRCR
ncbi:glycine zipper 2TM domain-containing protein [Sphingomonas rubra]|uniref:17 kDa surface antigen n=1 Tax=Sphingomonas rubra TaxID=634430 RepID=A0A1I5RST3_9SPHN|nr:glycine zipper 2TM domain-containing protein [Sphingomonas rubra]SFP61321.1 Glycine zipper 2TM domain-containing protein [Sphingomonas rubra]